MRNVIFHMHFGVPDHVWRREQAIGVLQQIIPYDMATDHPRGCASIYEWWLMTCWVLCHRQQVDIAELMRQHPDTVRREGWDEDVALIQALIPRFHAMVGDIEEAMNMDPRPHRYARDYGCTLWSATSAYYHWMNWLRSARDRAAERGLVTLTRDMAPSNDANFDDLEDDFAPWLENTISEQLRLSAQECGLVEWGGKNPLHWSEIERPGEYEYDVEFS